MKDLSFFFIIIFYSVYIYYILNKVFPMSSKEKELKIEKKLSQSKHIDCDLSVGLVDKDVQDRIENGLVNKMPKHVTKSIWRILRDNVLNFFNLLLLTLFVVMLVAQLPFTYYLFMVVIGANITIGVIQDLRARHLSNKLRVVSYPVVKVLRNGKEVDIAGNELVLSDIVLLKAGDQIIVDSTVMEGTIEVNESMLTGESVNIVKHPGDIIYSGSYVTSGNAKTRVDQLGKANYAEKLTIKAKQIKNRKSEILRTLSVTFKIISFFVITISIAMVVTYILQGKFDNYSEFRETITKVAGSLVTMIPAGMYLLTSLTLAVGVIQLATKRMLVQEMYCIEMLARVDVLCFDKTGTITDGSMRVKEISILGKNDKREVEKILHTLVTATGDSNPTANALLDAYKATPILHFHSSVAFNSKRKFSAVMLEDGRSYVLGAREFLPHKDKDLDKLCEAYEKQGLRVMLLAMAKRAISIEEDLPALEPAAIVVLEDHIREDAISNILWFKNNGVQIKIISGDNPISVSEIARRVGVDNAEKYISLDGIKLEEIDEIADNYTVFGRVSPEQKEALVHALQKKGHKVAMTGDGVNDILALKAADCSIAMASGSSAAQNVSHIVSLDSNFSSLPDVVSQGRRVINNLQRTCSLFLVKTIFAIVLSVFFLIGGWINSSVIFPFVTNNVYVWEFFTIGAAAFFLSFQPNNERLSRSTFLANIATRSIPAGLTQCIIVIVFYILYLNGVLDFDTFIIYSVLTFSAASFIVLFRVCMPFDIYRVLLYIVLVLLAGSTFIADVFTPHDPHSNLSMILKLNYSTLNSSNWWVPLVGFVGALIVYAILEFISVRINWIFERKEERKLKNESI